MINWVKCTDKLPEEGVCVLIYMPNISPTSMHVAYLAPAKYPDRMWFIREPFYPQSGYKHTESRLLYSFKVDEISHWSYLPPPPEEI